MKINLLGGIPVDVDVVLINSILSKRAFEKSSRKHLLFIRELSIRCDV